MAINYTTTLVTATPYVVDERRDEVILVNVARPSEIIIPRPTSILPADQKQSYYIKDYSGNAGTYPITIRAEDGEPIDGTRFALINAGYGHIQLVYDGRDWMIIA